MTAVFLENIETSAMVTVDSPASMGGSKTVPPHADLIKRHIELFVEGCANREVNSTVYQNGSVPATELIKLSRFADVLIIDGETSFNKSSGGVPSQFVRNLLKKSECPVIIAPESFGSIDEIVFTYNDSASSLFATKQFIYLFPELYSKTATVIQVNQTGAWDTDDLENLKELLSGYFTDIRFEAIKGRAELELFKSLFNRTNIFLVMGAYGRSALARFFVRSPADLIIKTVIQPIFIAHAYRTAGF